MPSKPLFRNRKDRNFALILIGFAILAIAIHTTVLLYTAPKPEPSPAGDNTFGVLLLLFGGLFFYFIPSIAAWHKRNFGAILILNFLLGWTVIGWIVALVWGWTNDAPVAKA